MKAIFTVETLSLPGRSYVSFGLVPAMRTKLQAAIEEAYRTENR